MYKGITTVCIHVFTTVCIHVYYVDFFSLKDLIDYV